MKGLLVGSVAAAMLSSVQAQNNPTWYGIVRPAPGASTVSLVELNDNATVKATIGSVNLGATEYPHVGAVRCLRNFCLFATSTADNAQSFIYNVSVNDASITLRSACPGLCHNLHVEYSTGNAYTVSIVPHAGSANSTVVTDVTNGKAVPVLDISTAVGQGYIQSAHTSHCSEYQSMYIGVTSSVGAADSIIKLNYVNPAVTGTFKLSFPIFTGLWATCDGTDVVGGTTQHNTTYAEFGTTDAKGQYSLHSKVGLPSSGAYTLNKFLTATSPGDYKDDFITSLTSTTNPSNRLLWAVDPYGGGSDDFTSVLTVDLIGAAWDRNA